MNQLFNFFRNNNQNAIHKWLHYFEIYDRHFNVFKNKPISLLEIGVFQGGSLNMWRDYFGNEAKIYGIDLNPECKKFETDNTKIFIGSQDDSNFLNQVKLQVPKLDIIIDDGGHKMKQQITSFEHLYDHVNDEGVYLVEDLHTSYWGTFEGGVKKPGTFVEYSKNFIDLLNAWHYCPETISEFTKSTFGLHFYDSILVIEKRKILAPKEEMTGKIMIDLAKFSAPNENS